MDRGRTFLQVTRLMREMMLLVTGDGLIAEANPAGKRMLSAWGHTGDSLSLASLVADPPGRVADCLTMWARSSELLPAVLSLRTKGSAPVAYRVEGGLLFPPTDGSGSGILVRLRPKEIANASFAALNREIQVANRVKREVQSKLETLALQHARILELSAPIIDVWEGILLLPLIGRIDRERADQITQDLLDRIVARSARWVILDLTSAEALDATIGEHFMKLTTAVNLVGARCILTGLGPQLAAGLVSLGVSTEGFTFLGSLKEGLKYCLGHARSG